MTDNLPFVFGWQADTAGCGFYRIELPVREYIRRGGAGLVGTDMTTETHDRADVIIGQRIVGDPPTRVWREMCAKGDKLCILEIDDDLFNIHPSNPAYSSFTPHYLENLKGNISCAHIVTVTTPHLAKMLRPLHSDIRVVPNYIPEWLTDYERPRCEATTIGWSGGPSHQMDWEDATPQIGRFLQRNPTVEFHGVGGVFASMLKWPLEQMRSTRWADGVENYYKLLDFDIGVIPLKPHLFNRSKSHIKALEFAALGIPVVASDFGPYERFVQKGKTGYLVQRDHEWASILRDLVNDPVRRAKLGYEARLQAKANTIEGNIHKFTEVWGVELPDAA